MSFENQKDSGQLNVFQKMDLAQDTGSARTALEGTDFAQKVDDWDTVPGLGRKVILDTDLELDIGLEMDTGLELDIGLVL